jgi:two-component system chemotaxis sensor kinase CheA
MIARNQNHADSGTTARPGAARVLVIDPSSFFRHLLQPLLLGAGYDVVTVATAEAGLELRDRGVRADLVVIGTERPHDDGERFAEACRKGGAWQGIPIIALSTSPAPERTARDRRVSCFDARLPKLDHEALLGTLNRYLWLPSSSDEDERDLSDRDHERPTAAAS